MELFPQRCQRCCPVDPTCVKSWPVIKLIYIGRISNRLFVLL